MAAAPASSVAAGGAADGPKLRSPLGKPVPLSDITNTGRPNPARSIHAADVLKENAKLIHLLGEKTRIIDVSRIEMHKLRLALQASHQQNLHFAQANSQMLVELNLAKDKLKTLQHELSCTTAMLKVKASELERKNKAANRLRKEVNSQEVMRAIPSKLATVEAHQIDSKATSSDAHHLVETQSDVPSNTGQQEPQQDKANKRITNKRKSESCEGVKNAEIVKNNNKPHLQSIGSLHHEDPRKPQWRRSTRLNPGSYEVAEVSCETLHEDTVVPLVPSFIVPKLYEPNTGKDMGKPLQNELPCNATVQGEKALELKNNEIVEQPQMEMNLEEIQETCPRVAGVEAHKIDDKASDTNQNHLADTQLSLPFNIEEHPEPPQEIGTKRGANNKQNLKSCEDRKESNIEDTNACHSNSSEPWHHAEKMKHQRRKSSRLNLGSCEVAEGTFETLHEDVIIPVASTSSNALIEQRKNEKHKDCRSSIKSSEEQATGKRSLVGRPSRRAAEKIVSYKEIPLNVKMRRP